MSDHDAPRPSADQFWDNPPTLRMLDAVTRNDAEAVRLAVENGAKPNLEGRDGITPLLFGMFYPSNLRAINALLDCGADPNLQSPGSPSVMGLAVQQEGGALLRLFLDHAGNPSLEDGSAPLTFIATYAEQFDNLRLLLDAGANVNAMTRVDGKTLLLLLASLKFWEVALEVLEREGDPTLPDGKGEKMAAILLDRMPSPSSPRWSAYEAFCDACAGRGVRLGAKG